jgi:hypothetical protein
MSFKLVKTGIREPVRLLVTGDRKWTNKMSIFKKLRNLRDKCGLTLTVVHGGCEGADLIADWACKVLGIDRIIFPANWVGRNDYAGPYRNQRMLDEGKPNLVWAFHSDIENSKGTKDMIRRAEKAGLKVRLFVK